MVRLLEGRHELPWLWPPVREALAEVREGGREKTGENTSFPLHTHTFTFSVSFLLPSLPPSLPSSLPQVDPTTGGMSLLPITQTVLLHISLFSSSSSSSSPSSSSPSSSRSEGGRRAGRRKGGREGSAAAVGRAIEEMIRKALAAQGVRVKRIPFLPPSLPLSLLSSSWRSSSAPADGSEQREGGREGGGEGGLTRLVVRVDPAAFAEGVEQVREGGREGGREGEAFPKNIQPKMILALLPSMLYFRPTTSPFLLSLPPSRPLPLPPSSSSWERT